MLFISSNVTGIVIRMQSFESTTRGTAFRVKPSIIYFHIFFFFSFCLNLSFACIGMQHFALYKCTMFLCTCMHICIRVCVSLCVYVMYVCMYMCACVYNDNKSLMNMNVHTCTIAVHNFFFFLRDLAIINLLIFNKVLNSFFFSSSSSSL